MSRSRRTARHAARRTTRRWEPRPVQGEERDQWLGQLEARFGIPPAVFDGFHLVEPNVSHLAIVPRDLEPPTAPAAVFQGMLLLHTNMGQPKPTTPAAMAFGHHATRHVIRVDDAQARDYLSRRDVLPSPAQMATCETPGWVLLRHAHGVLGVGQWIRGSDPARIRSDYPKAWALSEPAGPASPNGESPPGSESAPGPARCC